MDKLFYTLEETAQRLGKSVDEIQAMTEAGDLQQYRDRDKIMYQRDQVEAIAPDDIPGGSGSGSFESDLKEATGISLEDTGTMDLSATGTGAMASTDTNTPSPVGLDETDSLELTLDDSNSGTGSTADAADAADIMGITDDPSTQDTGLTATASGIDLDADDTGGEDFTGTGFGLSATGLGLADTADETAFSLDETGDTNTPAEDAKEQTGISVFDAGEIDTADPMAQTQVSSPNIDDDMLALESVGSGSGLLDLTRESDDTSLGAELLDEIYPTSEGSDAKIEDLSGSSAVFETGSVSGIGATLADTGSGADFDSVGLSGLENSLQSDSADLAPGAPGDPTQTGLGGSQSAGPVNYGPAEPEDPGGSGFVGGMLIGAFVALVITLIVAISTIGGASSAITETLGNNTTALYSTAGGILIAAIVFGVIFGLIGKASAR